MARKRNTIEELGKTLSAKKFRDFIEWVEIVPPSGDASLPRLHFVWEEKVHVAIPDSMTDEEVLAKDPNAEIRESAFGGGTTRHLWATTGKLHHRWFCNFRRYGWAWSSTSDGLLGYGQGVVYSNSLDGGLACTTSEQVVRETAIAAFWMNPFGVPSLLFRNSSSFDRLQELVDDALAHVSDYALNPIDFRMRHGGTANGGASDLVPPPKERRSA